MKKTLGLGLVLLLLSNNAFATKARLLALGMDETDNEGSYYIDSVRNIFLNAANVNDFGNTLIFEWGDKGQDSSGGNDQARVDTNFSPKAGGGFLMNSGDYVWGAYLGNESNTSSLLRIVGSAENSIGGDLLASSDNQIDFFLGSEANGIKWGANVVYTKAEDKEKVRKDSGYAVRLGAATDSWDAFVNASIGGSAEGQHSAGAHNHKFDGSIGIHVGGGYNVSEEGKVYAYVKQFGWEQTDSDGANVTAGKNKSDGSFTTYALGYGHTMKTDSGTFFTNIYYRMKEIEVKFVNVAKAENTELPITFGYEAAATSWLTLRGSVTQNIMGSRKNDFAGKGLNPVAVGVATSEFGANTTGKKVSQRDSTEVRAGASLNFGQLVVDGLIGTAVTGTAPRQSRSGSSSLRLDEVMARVGATYSF